MSDTNVSTMLSRVGTMSDGEVISVIAAFYTVAATTNPYNSGVRMEVAERLDRIAARLFEEDEP
jgi:hypothetical protein